MDNIKHLINFILPVTVCNFKCHYCYIGQENKFAGELGKLDYSPEYIARALTIERLGGVCHMNMCGLGETLLAPYAVDLAERMLRNGHFVSVVTNGTVTTRIDELCALPEDMKQRLFFKFSFHYLELRRLGLTNEFFDNVRRARDSGCAYSIELTVNDDSVGDIAEIQEQCRREIGAVCHVIESRNNLDGFSRLTKLPIEKHQEVWNSFNSPLFDFQQTQWMVKRSEFCYAGDWIVSLNIGSGWMMPCFAGGNAIQNIYEDIDEPIRFTAIGKNCPWNHCYAAYVLLTTGVIPEIKTPCYAHFRDRISTDGASWLTPKIKTFFESKLSQSNDEYSKTKKAYISALMGQVYSDNIITENTDILISALRKAFIEQKISTVGIYGTDKLGLWLKEIMISAGIQIKYIADEVYISNETPDAKEKIKRQIKYPLKKLLNGKRPVLLNRYDKWPKVDVVIISDYQHFEGIKKEIIRRKIGKILSITELVN